MIIKIDLKQNNMLNQYKLYTYKHKQSNKQQSQLYHRLNEYA